MSYYRSCFHYEQTLKTENLGKVKNFTAVPGCGLKCEVSQLEPLLASIDIEGVNNRKNRVGSINIKTDHSVYGDIELATMRIGGSYPRVHR